MPYKGLYQQPDQGGFARADSRAILLSRSSTSGSNLTGNCAPNAMPHLYSSADAHSSEITIKGRAAPPNLLGRN